MSTTLNLKELEKKAWRSTYQDGLWDIYYGLIVICMGFFIYRPESGYSPANIIFMTVMMLGCYGLFWAGKRYITLPRMGQVKFSPARKKRTRKLTLLLVGVILVQVGFVLVQILAWVNPAFGAKVNGFLGDQGLEHLAVALIGSLFVFSGMMAVAFIKDFPRGFVIAALMSLAVFLMIWLNQPIFAVIIGLLIALPGVLMLIRFVQKYPVPQVEV